MKRLICNIFEDTFLNRAVSNEDFALLCNSMDVVLRYTSSLPVSEEIECAEFLFSVWEDVFKVTKYNSTYYAHKQIARFLCLFDTTYNFILPRTSKTYTSYNLWLWYMFNYIPHYLEDLADVCELSRKGSIGLLDYDFSTVNGILYSQEDNGDEFTVSNCYDVLLTILFNSARTDEKMNHGEYILKLLDSEAIVDRITRICNEELYAGIKSKVVRNSNYQYLFEVIELGVSR